MHEIGLMARWRHGGAAGVMLCVALSSCGPTEPLNLPGDPVKACQAGIQEACGILGLQQYTMQSLSRPNPTPAVQPVLVHQPRSTRTSCQRIGQFTHCNTNYQ